MERPAKRGRRQGNAEPDESPSTPFIAPMQSNGFDGRGIQNTGQFNARDVHFNWNAGHEPDSKLEKDLEEDETKKKLEEHRQALLKSLRFVQMDARYESIRKSYKRTCRWFLEDPDYLQWLKNVGTPDTERFLWIKGKPGAGKSTLMRFLLEHTQQAKSDIRKGAILHFFFNARGNELEKTTFGLYRSLLVQLLESYPSLQSILDNIKTNHNEWPIESVKRLFEKAVDNLVDDPIVCFIDALDECEENEVRDLVEHISELCDDNIRIQICLASRHYPHITIRGGRDIILEDRKEHHQDITSYVHNKLCIGTGAIVDEIRNMIQARALGVFMWVVLVVKILNQECDAGRRDRLRETLRQTPSDLHTLFRDILMRGNKETPGLLPSIQWILFSRHPLSPKQLYFAILSRVEPARLAKCHTEGITDDDIAKFVLDNSKGLAESTKSEFPTVQFIHESVRDFLLKDDGLRVIWPGAGSNPESKSHEALKQGCVAYLESEPVAYFRLPLQIPEASSTEATELRNRVNGKLPFLEYANQSVLYHADMAQSDDFDQTEFLASFPLSKWVMHHNLFHPDQTRRYTTAVSLRYVLAAGNLGALIRAQPTTLSCLDVECERYGTPLFAALSTDSANAARALIEHGGPVEIADPSNENDPIQTSDLEDWCSLFRYDFTFAAYRGVMFHLVEARNEKLLEFLYTTKHLDIESEDILRWHPLSYAAGKGLIGMTSFILDRDVSPNVVSTGPGVSPLTLALQNGYSEIAALLMERGAKLESYYKTGWTSYIPRQPEQTFHATARLLIEQGVDMNACDHFGHTPLTYTLREGFNDTAKLLIERGADINVADQVELTPIAQAAESGSIDMAMLLIQHGADIHAIDYHCKTPLSRASSAGQIDMVRFLIYNGADVNFPSSREYCPLSWALRYNQVEVGLLLVLNGANVDLAEIRLREGKEYSQVSALTWAISKGHGIFARVLQDRGAHQYRCHIMTSD
ncbi:hypothetical protein PG984_002748 [Apiospora sp. TS-2023a]